MTADPTLGADLFYEGLAVVDKATVVRVAIESRRHGGGTLAQGGDIRDIEYDRPPDDELKRILGWTKDFKPRAYYKKEKQPPTVFDVLDDFADSIVAAIKA